MHLIDDVTKPTTYHFNSFLWSSISLSSRCSGQALVSIQGSHIMVLLFPTFCQDLKRSSGISMWVVLNTRSCSTGAYLSLSLFMLCMYLDTICMAYSAQFSFSDISIALIEKDVQTLAASGLASMLCGWTAFNCVPALSWMIFYYILCICIYIPIYTCI